MEHTLCTYDAVAAEYYDPTQHPTCRNFSDGNLAALQAFFGRASMKPGDCDLVCDVGPGDSAMAKFMSSVSSNLSNLVLLDYSMAMLTHSFKYKRFGAHMVVASAEKLPLKRRSIDLVVSSLGDSYNTEMFWTQVSFALKENGRCFFTTPSFEWASRFRNSARDERPGCALFVLRDGRSVYLPSYIYAVEKQCAIMKKHGLAVVEIFQISMDVLPPPWSPKLADANEEGYPVVVGYFAMKMDCP